MSKPATTGTAVHQASLSFTISWNLHIWIAIELVMPSNRLILCLLLQSSIFPSIRVFSNESALRITWPEFWSFSISPSSEYSELIFFSIDWFGLLAIQGTIKSPFQYYNSKASIILHSHFLIVQHSCPYMTIEETTALTIGTFVSKVTSLLFNMMSRFVIAFLPRSKHF